MTRPSETAIRQAAVDSGFAQEDAPDIFERVQTLEQVEVEQRRQDERVKLDCAAVFNTAPGQRLATYLRQRFVEAPILHPDPNQMIVNATRHDFVLKLIATAAEDTNPLEDTDD